MLGWPGSWDKRKTDKVWLGQPEANPSWKTWFLTFFLISFFSFLLLITRKIKTSSSTTTNDKQLSHKNRATAEARSLSFKVPRFFFWHMKFKNNFFSPSFLWNTHKTFIPQSSWIQNSSIRVQSNSKKGSDSVEFLFTPLCFYTHKHTLLGLAYIDIWDGGRGRESGVNAVDFQWIGALGDIMGVGWFGDQYDPAEYNLGAAALARMHTVLDSSGTRKKEKKKARS